MVASVADHVEVAALAEVAASAVEVDSEAVAVAAVALAVEEDNPQANICSWRMCQLLN